MKRATRAEATLPDPQSGSENAVDTVASGRKDTAKARRRVLYLMGMLCCVVPPLLATLSYFPLWAARGSEHMISGISLLLLLLCLCPMYKSVGVMLRSAASYMLWLVLFVLFFLLSRIADELTVISFFGFIGNLTGALFFRLSRDATADIERGARGQ